MNPKVDLSVLARAGPAQEGVLAATTPDSVPMPRRRWKTRVLLPAAIFAAAGGLLAYSAREALIPAVEVTVVPVVARQVEAPAPSAGSTPGDSSGGARAGVTVQAPGWVEADPFVTNVAALAGGVVREVLVLEGDRVEAGQVVARLIDDDARLALAAAEADLAERDAALAIARAELEAAERDWAHPIERTRQVAIAKATAAEIRAELAKLEPEILTERARAAEIREEYTRLTRLHESRALAEGDLVRWEQRLKAQEGVVAATEARRDVLAARLERQEAELAAAQENLRLRIDERRALDTARGALARAEAALARARAARDEAALRLARMEITSPASGIVLSRLIEPGTRLMTSDDMSASLAVRLYDPARLQVRVDVPLADAMRIAVGQEAQIVTEAMPDRTFRGRVSRLVHEANIQKNTVQVKVAILDTPADGPHLKPEMLTRVTFGGGRGAPAPGRGTDAGGNESGSGDFAPAGHILVIPRSALVDPAGDAASVWIVDQSRRVAALRPVRYAPAADADRVNILSGLRPGDRVILDRAGPIRDGTRVRAIAESARDGGSSWR